MPILHIGKSTVLFKLNPDVTEAQLAELRQAGEEMVGQIPGLKEFKMGPVLSSTAHRAQGFDMGVMTVLETEADVLAYAPHPAHQKVHKLRLALCRDTLVYDMVI
ncbi:hypothetical protein BX600DRAFT_436336 [Xylariales sp. PMI_506]|nr:hypothetical protein BX600DRAFT_436336 [Xylariales sp. PMI_506]